MGHERTSVEVAMDVKQGMGTGHNPGFEAARTTRDDETGATGGAQPGMNNDHRSFDRGSASGRAPSQGRGVSGQVRKHYPDVRHYYEQGTRAIGERVAEAPL